MTLPIQFLQLAGQLFSDFAIEWFEPIIFAFYGHRNRPLTLDPFWLPLFSQMDEFDTVNWPHILRDIVSTTITSSVPYGQNTTHIL